MEAVNLICFNCKHLSEWGIGCAAFPEGIPDEITSGDNLHSERLPEQKNNLIFTPNNKNETNTST